MANPELWRRYCNLLCTVPELGLTLDVSRMTFDDAFLAKMEPAMRAAFTAMEGLERGDIANPDENRMVGHYWLRAPELAPTGEIAAEIKGTQPDRLGRALAGIARCELLRDRAKEALKQTRSALFYLPRDPEVLLVADRARERPCLPVVGQLVVGHSPGRRSISL